MLGIIVTLIFSGTLSIALLKGLKKSKVLFNFALITLIAWYLPCIISLLLPFDHFGLKDYSFVTSILALNIVNLILSASLFAYRRQNGNKKKYVKNQNPININKSVVGTQKQKYYYHIYFIFAVIGVVLQLIQYFRRGYTFSVEAISSNRQLTLESYDVDASSFLARLFSGFIYYLLFTSISIYEEKFNHSTKVSIKWLYFTPFLIYSVLVLLSGKKSPVFYGLLIISLKFICFYGLRLKTILIWSMIGLFSTTAVTTVQNQIRSASIASAGFEKQMDVMAKIVKTDIDHPLYQSAITSPPAIYSGLSSLYLYFGVQYDMLYATISINRNSYFITPGFISFQPVNRLFNLFLDLEDNKEYDSYENFQSLIERKYNAIPNVWGTFFSILYIEGGWVLILIFTIIYVILIYNITYQYSKNKTENSEFNLLLIFLILILFFMNTPFRNPAFLSMIFASLLSKPLNNLCYMLAPKSKKNKHIKGN